MMLMRDFESNTRLIIPYIYVHSGCANPHVCGSALRNGQRSSILQTAHESAFLCTCIYKK